MPRGPKQPCKRPNAIILDIRRYHAEPLVPNFGCMPYHGLGFALTESTRNQVCASGKNAKRGGLLRPFMCPCGIKLGLSRRRSRARCLDLNGLIAAGE